MDLHSYGFSQANLRKRANKSFPIMLNCSFKFYLTNHRWFFGFSFFSFSLKVSSLVHHAFHPTVFLKLYISLRGICFYIKEVHSCKKQTSAVESSAGWRSRNQMTLFDFPRQSCVPLFWRFLRGNSWLLSVKIHKLLMWDGIWKAQSQPLTFKNNSPHMVLTEVPKMFQVGTNKLQTPYDSLCLLWSIKGESSDRIIKFVLTCTD